MPIQDLKDQIARSQCAPLKGARSALADKKKGPKSVLGKLWGNGKGKFRTDGKYSSATVPTCFGSVSITSTPRPPSWGKASGRASRETTVTICSGWQKTAARSNAC